MRKENRYTTSNHHYLSLSEYQLTKAGREESLGMNYNVCVIVKQVSPSKQQSSTL
jgi:hypothetical protein